MPFDFAQAEQKNRKLTTDMKVKVISLKCVHS